eukprot:10501270-Alexandrium_andersonii.AAC.1
MCIRDRGLQGQGEAGHAGPWPQAHGVHPWDGGLLLPQARGQPQGRRLQGRPLLRTGSHPGDR